MRQMRLLESGGSTRIGMSLEFPYLLNWIGSLVNIENIDNSGSAK